MSEEISLIGRMVISAVRTNHKVNMRDRGIRRSIRAEDNRALYQACKALGFKPKHRHHIRSIRKGRTKEERLQAEIAAHRAKLEEICPI